MRYTDNFENTSPIRYVVTEGDEYSKINFYNPDMRVFVSIPMKGRADHEVDAEIRDMVMKFHEVMKLHDEDFRKYWLGEDFSYDDYTILFLDNLYADISTNALSQFNLPNKNNISLLYLGEAIKTMAYCDTIMLAPGFENAKGCQVESYVYQMYGDYNRTIIMRENYIAFSSIKDGDLHKYEYDFILKKFTSVYHAIKESMNVIRKDEQ
jgi:hypothetical protein